MFSYSVTVFSGKLLDSGTSDHVYIKLVGMKGESRWELILSEGLQTGKSCTFTIECPTSLGELVVVELDRQDQVVTDDWFCAKVTVVTPEEDTAHFPCYRWISDKKVHYFRDGKDIGDAGNEETEKEMETAVTVVPWSNAETIGADTMGAPGLEHLRRTSVTQSARRALVTNHGGKHKSEPLEEIIPAKRAFDDINPLVVSSTQMFRRTMAYWVTVFTGDLGFSGTINPIYIKLVGTDGESERLRASSWIGFRTRQEYTFPIECPTSLGDLLVVELDKKPLPLTLSDNWFCAKVTVRSETPENDTAHFPVYRWISDNKVHYFREGKAKRVFDDINPLVKSCRKKELKERAQDYRWDSYKQGLPDCMKSEGPLPLEVQFSNTKKTEFDLTGVEEMGTLLLEGLINLKEPWKSIDDMRNAFSFRSTHLSDYVQQHWREDKFFGYQFLNGINPMIIQRCSKLPENFPVTNDMVRASLHGARSLTDQIKKGNIYLVDYKQLDGVTANVINGKQQYLTAPLVLLQKTPDHKLIPIAIQLKQKPGEDNPIFFPTDSEYDWLLAKIFVRSAHFNEHELNVHLLRTHLLSEVFAVALLRNFPMVHPLYKLLIPHTRYTLQINTMARAKLISKGGVFTQYSASGGEGMFTILQRELSSLTYSSLCLPEDIAARGLESIPNFYYRDDGLRLWDVIHRFVQGVIGHYYKSDLEVKKDSELQNWIKDIFLHGFLSRDSSGIPESFKTVAELVKFVTMVIFTGSAQHSAVNTGQFDYGGWPLNSPISLQLPPPTTKGQSSESTMLQTLADVNCTAFGVGTISLLSTESTDFVPLGEYPQEQFSEDAPCRLIKGFQAELKTFSESVKARNSSLEVPYTYLDPGQMENSVAL